MRVMADGKVVVTAPPHLPERDVRRFLAEHEEWITAQRQKTITNQSALTVSRQKLFFRGQEYDFRLNVGAKKPGVIVDIGRLIVTTPSEDHQTVREILEKWYRLEAKRRFTDRVPLLSDLVGKDLMRVTIRSQRTRWGSCSSRNTVSLNWRLIMAPDWVSDYVVYHELAHLTHMNHSQKFWQLVADYFPRYKEAERWLKEHHALLQF